MQKYTNKSHPKSNNLLCNSAIINNLICSKNGEIRIDI